MNLAAIRVEVAFREFHFFLHVLSGTGAVAFAGARPPSDDGIVVVGARVSHAMTRIVMGLEVRSLGVLPKSKLQDSHAREPKAIAQAFNLGRNDAEIFGEDGQAAERCLHRLEKRRSRPFYPPAVDSGGGSAWDFVIGLESAKVVKADHVQHFKRTPEARYPPLESCLGVHVPAINRVAPALSRSAEVIRRNARNDARLAVGFEIEHPGRSPHIRTVLGDRKSVV